jgi:tRNA pseudouridine38-40 synthase
MKTEWSQTREVEDEWRFEVQADAFLYRMVRRLVFVQVAVGQGKFSVEAITNSLVKPTSAEKRRGGAVATLPAGLAPAHGLTLVEVAYPAVESMGQ